MSDALPVSTSSEKSAPERPSPVQNAAAATPPQRPVPPKQAPPPPGGKSSEGGGKMSFIDHLMELRWRLWISVITVLVTMVLSLVYYERLNSFLQKPLLDLNASYAQKPDYAETLEKLHLPPGSEVVLLVNDDPMSTMVMICWMGVWSGLVLASPIILYQMWAFISPGLRSHEKRAIQPVLFGGVVFFLIGVGLAYYLLFPVTLTFFVGLDLDMHIRPYYTFEKYSSLLINMMLISGLVWEAPLVVAVLARLSFVRPSHLTQYWRMCVFGAFLLGAALSPGTDMISMILFSVMLLSLYIVSIAMAVVFYRKPENKPQ